VIFCRDNKKREIVGVVGDIRRDMEGHHYAGKSSFRLCHQVSLT
jgi:hypothetical protein